jgi:hypothetical protein
MAIDNSHEISENINTKHFDIKSFKKDGFSKKINIEEYSNSYKS